MGLVDQITPHLYAFVKKNKIIRDTLKPTWDFVADASNKIKSLLNPSSILPPPQNFIESTKEWINSKSENYGGFYREIHPERAIQRKAPKTIESKIFWKFQKNLLKTEPATFVSGFDDGRVWDEGNVITPDNCLLGDVSRTISCGEYIKTTETHPIFSKQTLPPLKYINERVAVLSAAGGRGYYHWMMDVIPRIQLIRSAGISLESIDKFLINNYVSKFHVESLQMLGIPKNKIIESHWNPHVRAKHLVVPSLVGDTGDIPQWACEFLRQEFLPKISSVKSNPKRLYFNRSQVTHRKVTNEPEIIALLEKMNFQNISLESLPFQEQISLLSTAEVVVVPHGAGLTNIVFCSPGTKIIELMTPKAVNIMYWTLSNQANLDYYYLFAEGERPADNVNAYHNSENFSINLNDLKAIMELAEIN